jgi:hypothetical protein
MSRVVLVAGALQITTGVLPFEFDNCVDPKYDVDV